MIRLTNVRLSYTSLRPPAGAPSAGKYTATVHIQPPQGANGSVVRHDVRRAVYFNRIIELGDPLGSLCWPSQVLSHPVELMRTSPRWGSL